MKILYDTLSGNTKRFAIKLSEITGLPAEPIADYQEQGSDGPFFLLTYTIGSGEVPASTTRFLEHAAPEMTAVMSSGSFHWGNNFGKAAEIISERYNVPNVGRFNKSGSQEDLKAAAEFITKTLPHERTLTLEEIYRTQ